MGVWSNCGDAKSNLPKYNSRPTWEPKIIGRVSIGNCYSHPHCYWDHSLLNKHGED